MDYLKTEALSKNFGRVKAVQNANIVLEKGKIYGLLGPNGSGKSTFMKLAAGLLHKSSGEIYVNGEKLCVKSKAEIAYMPTEPYFYDYMRISTVGKFHQDFYDDFDPTEYKSLIEYMGLSMDMKVSSLSSGMAAKLKLAAAMARDAKLFMLDEPLNGIDLVARDLIMSSIIKKANDDNIMLLSSHLIDVLENILDEVIFIKEGEIVLNGAAEDVREENGKSIVDLYKEVFQNV
jgi:ABC-2 type transport system ATP-binding protein